MTARAGSMQQRVCLCALLLLLGGCTPASDAADAVRFLRDLSAGVPASGDFSRSEVTWPHRGAAVAADLYRPAEPMAALVLAPGLGRDGRRDARLVAFATALARARFAVLVPDVPNFQAQRVAAGDGALLADALRYLLARPEGQGSVGIAAVSYAVGPAVLAALSPDLAPRIDVIAAIGGYYDTVAVVTFFTTGYFRDDVSAPWQRRTPNAYGKWVFVLANAERIEDAHDRSSLAAMARRKLDDLNADIADLDKGLGPEGRSVVDLLANADPARVPGLIAALPPAVRDDLVGLSLAGHDLQTLRAQVILIHGRDDAIVPYSESLALGRALPPGQAHVSLLDSLAHADLGPGDVADGFRLWQAAYALMRARHGGPPG
jgi:pimeloyl-ACP methyl ester carboxylesterase